MKKKLFSMLALLCLTAVSAWAADVPNTKEFTAPASWQKANEAYTANDLPEDFVACTDEEAAAWAEACTEDGAILIYSIDNVVVKTSVSWDKYSFTKMVLYGAGGSMKVYYTAAPEADPEPAAEDDIEVTPTANANEWTFLMPESDVELEPEYYTDLKEDEAIDYTAFDGTTADIWLCRTLKTGSWNTFASPVAIDADQLTTLGITAVKQLSTASLDGTTLTLNFTDATTIEAGKPYLVKVSADKEVGAFDEATVSGSPTATETSVVDFVPTLGTTTITGDDAKTVLFLGSGNKLLHPESLPSDMKGFRAYFLLKGEGAQARSFRLNMGDGETTGISLTPSPSPNGEGSGYYTLDGRKLQGQPANKGVYVKNGKKVIIIK